MFKKKVDEQTFNFQNKNRSFCGGKMEDIVGQDLKTDILDKSSKEDVDNDEEVNG